MISPTFHPFLALAITLAAGAIGCSGKQDAASTRSARGGQVEPEPPVAQPAPVTPSPPPPATASAPPASQPAATPSDDEFVQGRIPEAISGANLTYANGRLRCASEAGAGGRYVVTCRMVVVQPSGAEIAAVTKDASVKLAWLDPTPLAGGPRVLGCSSVTNATLARTCDFETDPAAVAPQVQFGVTVAGATPAETRTEAFVVLLPFTVGVVAGLVPQIPFEWADEAPALALAEVADVRQGFQSRALPPHIKGFDGVTSICMRGADAYFGAGPYVYKLSGETVTLYAGASPVRGQPDAAHRFRISFHTPLYLACEAEGVIVADQESNRLYRVRDAGSVEMLLGAPGANDETPAPDGTPAGAGTAVIFPTGLTLGPNGRIYFGDDGGLRIRYIDAGGKLATLATLDEAVRHLAYDAKTDRVYFTQPSTDTVGYADAAGAVHKLTPATTIVLPSGIATLPTGELLVAEEFARGSFDNLTNPGLPVNPTGNAVARLDPSTGAITWVAGQRGSTGFAGDGGPAVDALLQAPAGVAALDDGAFLIADTWNLRLRRVDKTGVITTVVGPKTRDEECLQRQKGDEIRLFYPIAVAYDAAGDLVVADAGADTAIRKLERQTRELVRLGDCTVETSFFNRLVRGVGGDGDGSGTMLFASFAVAPDGVLHLARNDGRTVQRYADGVFTTLFALPNPRYDAYVAQLSNPDLAGILGGSLPSTPDLPTDIAIAFDPEGRLYVADETKILRYDPILGLVAFAGTDAPGSDGDGGPAASARMEPSRLAFAADGTLYFTEKKHHRLRKVAVDGTVTTVAGTGTAGYKGDGGPLAGAELSTPTGLAVTPRGIYLVEANGAGGRVRVITPGVAPRIETIFGGGGTGDCGTGNLAGQAVAGEVTARIKDVTATTLCAGRPLDIAVRDRCAAPDERRIAIAITQTFGSDTANVVEIVRSCP